MAAPTIDHRSRDLPGLRPAKIRGDLGLSRERMARLFDVSARTIERWEEKDQPPASGIVLERLALLRKIVDLGLQVYTLRGLRAFLVEPQPVFGDRSGLDLIRENKGDVVYSEVVSDYEATGF